MQEFLKNKANDYTKLIQKLLIFGKSSLNAAYHSYVKRLQNKLTFLSRTTPKTIDFLPHAEEIINNNLIPALTNRDCPDKITRRVLSLPVRKSGLAINQPSVYRRIYSDSQNLSAPLVRPHKSGTRPNQERDPQRDPQRLPESFSTTRPTS